MTQLSFGIPSASTYRRIISAWRWIEGKLVNSSLERGIFGTTANINAIGLDEEGTGKRRASVRSQRFSELRPVL